MGRASARPGGYLPHKRRARRSAAAQFTFAEEATRRGGLTRYFASPRRAGTIRASSPVDVSGRSLFSRGLMVQADNSASFRQGLSPESAGARSVRAVPEPNCIQFSCATSASNAGSEASCEPGPSPLRHRQGARPTPGRTTLSKPTGGHFQHRGPPPAGQALGDSLRKTLQFPQAGRGSVGRQVVGGDRDTILRTRPLLLARTRWASSGTPRRFRDRSPACAQPVTSRSCRTAGCLLGFRPRRRTACEPRVPPPAAARQLRGASASPCPPGQPRAVSSNRFAPRCSTPVPAYR